MATNEYGHHKPSDDPRGPDFDHPHTPERERRMLYRKSDPRPDEACPICGEHHDQGEHPE